MLPQELVVAIVAVVLAVAAFVVALIQAVAAYSQLLASRSRCGCRVTGAFDLREGVWFALLTLTLNIRYRMPVFTIPGLRSRLSYSIQLNSVLYIL